MNTIRIFLEEIDGKINFRALLDSRNYLSQFEGFVSPQKVRESFLSQTIVLKPQELEIHIMIIMEVLLSMVLCEDDTVKLVVHEDMIYNDILFATR